ncbi:MAG: hypothetical protein CMI30_08270 [Opitutae bacterium]|nr:hypothetical protein [Opitutae bacterium]
MRTKQRVSTMLWLGMSFLAGFLVSEGAEERKVMMAKPTPDQVTFFESKVRPVLAANCFRCHGEEPSKEPKAGLVLTTLKGMLQGGESGPALIPGNLDKSRIIEAIRYRNENMSMPPKKPLKSAEVKVIEEWVSMGAPWPGFEGEIVLQAVEDGEPYDWAKFRKEHWSFQPVVKKELPAVKQADWPRDDLDRFVLARLETAGLKPNGPADKRVLIRRATLDLTGLPPTSAEVKAFLADTSKDAFAKVVDRLLDSERYGERWARHWLDVARYSDGLGGFGDGQDLPNAWRYRDWVVKALNADLPYDDFIRRQIAGDLIQPEPDALGTGFFAVGPTYKGDGGDPEATNVAKAETLSDRVDTFSRAFLGLTAACARCHDHKFDPITTKDYYAIAGIFNNTRNVDKAVAPKEEVDAYNTGQAAIRKKQDEIKHWSEDLREDGSRALMRQADKYLVELYRYHEQRTILTGIADRNAYAKEKGLEPKRLEAWERSLKDLRNRGKFPLLDVWFEKNAMKEGTEATEEEIIASAKKFMERLEPILKSLEEKDVEWRAKMASTGKRQGRPRAPGEDGVFIKHLRDGPCRVGNVNELGEAEKEKQKTLNEELAKMKKEAPPKPATAHVLADGGSGNMHVALRGDLAKRGEVAERKFLRVLAGDAAVPYNKGSGRLELAESVVDPANPLTSRVMVNRVWQWHFGQALVRTPSNFGTLGETPTHPHLLDWLARDFMENGWSLKRLHRKIMLSATWQMSSEHAESKFAKDGDNRLLWRMNPRKLDVESWRDSLLAASGELDLTLGGAPTSNIMDSPRRTIYSKISRSGDRFASDAFLRLFDFPAPQSTSAQRAVSTVPQQYLFMMNSPFMIKRAAALAQDLSALGSDEERIQAAYERLYARPVDSREMEVGLAFLGTAEESKGKWPQYAQVLLSAHEFMQIQ